jgi:hypothetical protein
MVPIEKLTDVQLMENAKHQEHIGDREHADQSLRYLRMRWRYGTDDHHKWPIDDEDGPRRG